MLRIGAEGSADRPALRSNDVALSSGSCTRLGAPGSTRRIIPQCAGCCDHPRGTRGPGARGTWGPHIVKRRSVERDRRVVRERTQRDARRVEGEQHPKVRARYTSEPPACGRRYQCLTIQWPWEFTELEAGDCRRQALSARRARPCESSLRTLETRAYSEDSPGHGSGPSPVSSQRR